MKKMISQPDDWWSAFEVQANRMGYDSISEFMGEAAKAQLPAYIQRKLSQRRGRGNPQFGPGYTPPEKEKGEASCVKNHT